MLTYESRGCGTRGDTAHSESRGRRANPRRPHFFDALGLIRTQELLKAGQYYGIQQYWTRAVDHGFSKRKPSRSATGRMIAFFPI